MGPHPVSEPTGWQFWWARSTPLSVTASHVALPSALDPASNAGVQAHEADAANRLAVTDTGFRQVVATRRSELHANLEVAIVPLREESSTMREWMCQVAAFMERTQALVVRLSPFTPAPHMASSPLCAMLAPSSLG